MAPLIALCIPSVILELENLILFHLAVSRNLHLSYYLFIFIKLILICLCIILARTSTTSTIAIVIGIMFALFIETNFRGAGTRPGTFDFFESSIWRWARWDFLAGFVGIALSWLLQRWRPAARQIGDSMGFGLACVGAFAIIGMWSWLASTKLGANAVSEFPPTKHFAIALLTALIGVGLAVDYFRRNSNA